MYWKTGVMHLKMQIPDPHLADVPTMQISQDLEIAQRVRARWSAKDAVADVKGPNYKNTQGRTRGANSVIR
jgi:hypothetical protein